MAGVFFLTYMYVHSWQVGNGGTLAYHFGQVVHALKTAKQLLKDELLAQPQNLQGQARPGQQGQPGQARPGQARLGLLAYQTQISLNVEF